MVRQGKVTENFPKRRTSSRAVEKRKLAKSVTEEGIEDDFKKPPAPSSRKEVDEDSLDYFQKALDTSSPANLPGREGQIYEVKQFLTKHLEEKTPGSLYISGAPGTGKTAVVQFVMEEIAREGKKKTGFYQIFVNCMCKRSPTDIYRVILEKVKGTKGAGVGGKGGSLKEKVQERLFLKSKTANMIVIVLDEMDQILMGTNEVLYTLFEWARTPGSRLILIGIANALDLTVRHLPFLHLNSSPVKQPKTTENGAISQCRTMSFPPYRREDIERIIQERVGQVGQNIFDATAIKFVAAKVAASTGDARSALHACKQAMVTTVEKQEQREVLKQADENGASLTLSPKKICIRNDQIGILAVSKALQLKKDDGPLPIQHSTILAALLRIHRDAPNTRDPLVDGVNMPIPIPTLYRQYRKICSLKAFSWIEESELPLVCEILQDRSLVSVVSTGGSTGKNASIGRSKKFGSPSSTNNKIGVLFDPRVVEGIISQGDLKTLFG